MPKENLITLCTMAGFTEVYRGPYQSTVRTTPSEKGPEKPTPAGPWITDRTDIPSAPAHVKHLLSKLNVDQADMPFTPKEHHAYAKPIGQKGVELFHFWNPNNWKTKDSKQFIRSGLAYYCWPNQERINMEWERQPSSNIFLLGGMDQQPGAYPDKWDAQAFGILSAYAKAASP